ncbi:MAG: glycosyltransferase family 2 protein [Candidatus Aenigmarchaeota archaeon]|nr:glycosyltransferase family 2 protein [Candidatus Aenigmarchaeota archaeon]
MNISIIVPTFNEEETIEEFLKKIKELKLQLKNFELIIVDDSFDNTAEIARSLMKKFKIEGSVLKRVRKRGKGSAIRDGLKLAKGKYIVLIDADLQYPVEKIPALIERLKECDIVNTRRLRKDPFHRKLLGLCFRILVFLLFGLSLETQSTFRAFRREVKEKIDFKADSWAWDVEFLYKAKKAGFKICSYPVIYEERKLGRSKINISTLLKMFLELIKIREILLVVS